MVFLLKYKSQRTLRFLSLLFFLVKEVHAFPVFLVFLDTQKKIKKKQLFDNNGFCAMSWKLSAFTALAIVTDMLSFGHAHR